MHRPCLVGAAIGLFASVAIGSTPAMATPCTNLQSLALQNTTITSATDNTTGVFVVPNSNPPQTITGLPAFCRVTATLTPTPDSSIKIEVWLPENTWNGRFLGTGGGGFQGIISYAQLASGIQAGFAVDQQRSRHRGLRVQPAFLRLGRQQGQPAGDRVRRSGDPLRPVCSAIRNGSRTSATVRST